MGIAEKETQSVTSENAETDRWRSNANRNVALNCENGKCDFLSAQIFSVKPISLEPTFGATIPIFQNRFFLPLRYISRDIFSQL
jgi:hypothetical protein